MWGFPKRSRYGFSFDDFLNSDSDEFRDSSDSEELYEDNNVDRKTKLPKLVNESLVKNKISGLFGKVEESMGYGEFGIHGLLPQAPNTTIQLKDGTVIKFPVLEEELAWIIPKFEQSRFGRGEDTILDTNVRDSLELKPSDFTIVNNQWEKFITSVLVPRISKELDISTPINANVYKLLLYKTGSFFERHHDSEKENMMFGTLVIQLPSKFSGGKLIVHHDGKTKTFDSSSKSESEEFNTYFSAFYCDCEHEVTKLTDGIRICLIYNLVLTGQETEELPRAPSMTKNDSSFFSFVKQWKKEQEDEGIIVRKKNDKVHDHSYNMPSPSSSNSEKNNDENVPKKLVYILSHQYTQKNLLYENLKSGDKAVATMMKNSAVEANLCVMLGILEKTTLGESCGGEFDSSDEDCCAQKHYHIKNLRLLSADKDITMAMSKITKMDKHDVSTFENEIIPLNRLRALEPYEKNRENTGNEGVQVTLQYRTAALILFQKESFVRIVAGRSKTGLQFSEQILLSKCKKLEGDPNNDELKTDVLECLEFLKKVSEPGFIGSYKVMARGSAKTKAQLMELLNALIFLNDSNLLAKFCTLYQACLIEHFDQMLPDLLKLSSKFGWDFVTKEVLKIFGKTDIEKSINGMKMIVDTPDDVLEKTQQMIICQEVAKIILDKLQKREKSTTVPLQLVNITKLYDCLCFANDSELFSNFFLHKAVIVHIEKLLPQLINLSSKLGWSFVSKELVNILQSIKDEMKSLGILKTLVETINDNNTERLESCREFAKTIMNAIQQKEKTNTLGNMMTPVLQQIDFMEGFCATASKIQVDFSEFFKSRDASVAITFLKDLAAKNNNVFEEPWLQIAKDWALNFKEAASKILIEPDWRKRTDFIYCKDSTCKDCPLMRRFMVGDDLTRLFHLTQKKRREHLEMQLRLMHDLLIVPGRIGTTGSKWTLSVTKQKGSTHLKDIEAKNLAKDRFTQLNSLLAANGASIEGLEQERIIIFLDQ